MTFGLRTLPKNFVKVGKWHLVSGAKKLKCDTFFEFENLKYGNMADKPYWRKLRLDHFKSEFIKFNFIRGIFQFFCPTCIQ